MLLNDFFFSFTQTDLFLSKKCFSQVWLGGYLDSLSPVCMNRDDYVDFIKQLPQWRQFTEELRVSLAVSLVEDGDRFGLIRRIFLNASSTSGDAYQWLLSLGFIHLTNFTGFYWIYFDQFINFFCKKFNLFFRRVIFILVYFLFFALAGFKLSFLRALFLISLKWFFRKSHLKSHQILFLALFIGCDVFFSGIAKVMGVMHYALALLGGYYVIHLSANDQTVHDLAHSQNSSKYQLLEQDKTATVPKKNGLKLHWNLALYSYLSCLVFNLIHGNISVFTPILSMITVPLFGALVFPVFILLAVSNLFFGERVQSVVRIFFYIVDEGIAMLSFCISKSGLGMLQISPSLALLSVLGGAIGWILFRSIGRVFTSRSVKVQNRGVRKDTDCRMPLF